LEKDTEGVADVPDVPDVVEEAVAVQNSKELVIKSTFQEEEVR
jgi:hypothetical protein